MKKKFFSILGIIYLSLTTLTVQATDFMEEWESRKSLPVESNLVNNWPEGPEVGAESAIVMEMNTHTILYAKNIDAKMYPASTTKILTCLLASQNCNLNDTVTFSYDAVHNVPSDGSGMGMDTGESITLEQAMYGILVGSANEAASAVGEHVAKTLGLEANETSFANLMNEYAKSIGCKNSHFVNANGLYNDDHYTSAYDLALIGCEFFKNESLCKMSSTPRYNIPVSETQPDDIWLITKNQLYKGKPYEYKYLLGSKTGYVSQARQTLVSGAEKDGMKLVCVVFKEESPYQFADTVSLFNYGFDNFSKFNISDNETQYDISNDDPFNTDNDLLGNSSSLLSLDKDSYIVLPRNATFTDAKSSIIFNSDKNSDIIASINYTYNNINVGNCNILFTKSGEDTISVSSFYQNEDVDIIADPDINDDNDTIFINIKKIILFVIIAAVVLVLILVIIGTLKSFNFTPRDTEDAKRRRKRNKEKRQDKKRVKRYLREQKRLNRSKRNAYKKRNR